MSFNDLLTCQVSKNLDWTGFVKRGSVKRGFVERGFVKLFAGINNQSGIYWTQFICLSAIKLIGQL